MALADDVDTAFDYPVHAIFDAGSRPMPKTCAPSSIFDVAAAARQLKLHGRFGASEQFAPPAAVVRADGVLKVTGARYPADRPTPEREERERQRRARQKPPKPCAKAKTRSRKLLELIGP